MNDYPGPYDRIAYLSTVTLMAFEIVILVVSVLVTLELLAKYVMCTAGGNAGNDLPRTTVCFLES